MAHRYSQHNVYDLVRSVGGSDREARFLASVVPGESGGRLNVINSIGATGLFQIYNGNRGGERKLLNHPKRQAKAALGKLRSQGKGAWAASRGSWQPYNGHGSGKGGGGAGGHTSYGGGLLQANTRHIPGIDRSGERQQAKLDALTATPGKMPSQNRLLSLASQLSDLQDTPGQDVVDLKAGKTTATRYGGGGGGVGRDGIPRGKSAHGVANFEGTKVAAWIKPYLVYARKHGWKGKVTSGYRSYGEQSRIYASGVRPAARPGTSNHEGSDFPRGAVDVSQAAQLNRILRRRGTKKLRWAGGKDPVHFSHPHGGSY